MDVNAAQNLIATLGFPIVVTGYLLWERFKVLSALTAAINNNTLVITKLVDRLGGTAKDVAAS